MKESELFGCYGGDGNLKEGIGGGHDALGELREEEIVWGEAETQQHKEASADGGGGEKAGTKINNGRSHRAMGRQRSLLSRQMEMQACTWTAGDRMSATVVSRKIASKGHEYEEVGGGGGGREEEGDGTQHNMDELIPPHELLARQYAASASFSVLHGAGRTLKGRDLRRLRNEVWRQTGFVD